MLFSQIDSTWEQIQKLFQKACLLRREGKNEEAVALLESELTPLVASWEKAPDNKAELEALFKEEMRRIDDAWALHGLLEQKFLHKVEEQVSEIKTAQEQTVRYVELKTNQDLEKVQQTTQAALDKTIAPILKELTTLKERLLKQEKVPPQETTETNDQLGIFLESIQVSLRENIKSVIQQEVSQAIQDLRNNIEDVKKYTEIEATEVAQMNLKFHDNEKFIERMIGDVSTALKSETSKLQEKLSQDIVDTRMPFAFTPQTQFALMKQACEESMNTMRKEIITELNEKYQNYLSDEDKIKIVDKEPPASKT